MEQYTAKSNSLTEQIIVQAGQMQQQVQGQPLMVQVSEGQLVTTGQPVMVQALPGGQGQTIMQVPILGHRVCSGYNRPHQERPRSGVDRLCKCRAGRARPSRSSSSSPDGRHCRQDAS